MSPKNQDDTRDSPSRTGASSSRKRSPKACLSCRTRKVRCDVAFKTMGCTNCTLDGKKCIVASRKTKRSSANVHSSLMVSQQTPATDQTSTVARIDDICTPDASDMKQCSRDYQIAATPDVPFVHHTFLCMSNISHIAPDDINHLDSQGCLRVPERKIMDELIKAYFQHVHPILPVVDEADFGSAYYQPTANRSITHVSVLLLQGMLFAACNYVPERIIFAMGFSTVQDARKVLYRRTKLLYDFGTESSPIALAQTSLLLTHWSSQVSGRSRRQNGVWMSLAIQHAKDAGAHIEASFPSNPPRVQSDRRKGQATLKRLWWCCIFCDRMLSLHSRRALMISRTQFDPDANPVLSRADLSHEIGHSHVFNAETKQRLAETLEQMAELCAVLTKVLTVVYPPDDVPACRGSHKTRRDIAKLEDCKAEMKAWHTHAQSVFMDFGQGSPLGPQTPQTEDQAKFDPVQLSINLVSMHYHTAMVAIHHHEILLHHTIASFQLGFPNLCDLGTDLLSAISELNKCVGALLARQHVDKIPSSFVPCVALPLLLHLLDKKLQLQVSIGGSSTSLPTSKRASKCQTGGELDDFPEHMKALGSQHSEDVDLITKLAVDVSNLLPKTVTMDNAASTSQGQRHQEKSGIMGWGGLIASQPGTYACLVLALDLELAWGNLLEGDGSARLLGHERSGLAGFLRQLLGAGEDDCSQSWGTPDTSSVWQEKIQPPSPPSPPYSASSVPDTYIESDNFNLGSYDATKMIPKKGDDKLSTFMGMIQDTVPQRAQSVCTLSEVSCPLKDSIVQDDGSQHRNQRNIEAPSTSAFPSLNDVFAARLGCPDGPDLTMDLWGHSEKRKDDRWIESMLVEYASLEPENVVTNLSQEDMDMQSIVTMSS